MIQLIRFTISDKSYPITYRTSITEVINLIEFEHIPVDTIYNADTYNNIFVLDLGRMTIREHLMFKRILAIRLIHTVIDNIEYYSYNSFYIYDSKSEPKVKLVSKELIISKLTQPISRSYIQRSKIDFLSLMMNHDNIVSYCRANPTKPLWSLFFESQAHYRNKVKDLPSDPKIWISSEYDHPIVTLFLNMVVRGNRDYVCNATIINNNRVENYERYPVFKPALAAIDLLLSIASNLF